MTTALAPEVSAIIVSWNSAAFLDACLGSLFAQRGVTVEVIVVDNGSTDGSAAFVKAKYPRARLVELDANLGFCAANNIGLAEAVGPFVLFANSDLILDEGFLAETLVAFSRDERIGSVGGKLLRFDRATIDSAGQFMTRSRRAVERGYGAPDGPAMSVEGYVFAICGAALFCRREMIEDISVEGRLFDDAFFAFSEDLDVGWRARLAGWRAWYAPRAVGYHYRGGSEGGGVSRWLPALVRRPRSLRYHILKNRWLTILKNDSPGSVARDLPFIAARDAALFGAGLAASPSLALDFARGGSLWREAGLRRRSFFSARGRWGARRPGARSHWVRWSAPLARDPDAV